MSRAVLAVGAVGALGLAWAGLAAGAGGPLPGPATLPGGRATVEPARPEAALTTYRPGLDGIAGLDARLGQALFERIWVSAPASTRAADGLGPLYNARACVACHVNLGRGQPPEAQDHSPSFILRLAQPDGGPDPVLGRQIQSFAVAGMPAEAQVRVTWRETRVALAGGETVALRAPIPVLSDLGWGAGDPATALGPRTAQPLVGLGPVSAIAEAEILAWADPDDRDGDGIRGRARLVDGAPGRFGRRAAFATVEAATVAALAIDMGLSTPDFPDPWGDCTPAQAACRAGPHGDGDARVHEVGAQVVGLIADYLRSLGVPARAQAQGPEIRRGAALFHASGCAACHRPSFPIDTAPGPDLIWPYSDFLLHDLGPGLADPAPEAGVAPGEWRTAPLWALGRAEAIGRGRASYLHDGRARSVLEAVLWHGGTAQPARDRVAAMATSDRAALLRFLESL